MLARLTSGNPSTLASQSAGVPGMSHHAQPLFSFFILFIYLFLISIFIFLRTCDLRWFTRLGLPKRWITSVSHCTWPPSLLSNHKTELHHFRSSRKQKVLNSICWRDMREGASAKCTESPLSWAPGQAIHQTRTPVHKFQNTLKK